MLWGRQQNEQTTKWNSISSFWQLAKHDNMKKQRNEILLCCSVVCSFWCLDQRNKTNKWQNETSFWRLVQKEQISRQNDEIEFHFVVCSFCRVGQGAKTNKQQNVITTFHFVVCSFCRVIQVDEMEFNFVVCSFLLPFPKHDRTTKPSYHDILKFDLSCLYLFDLLFVHFVNFNKAPKWRNDNAAKLGLAALWFWCIMNKWHGCIRLP